MPHSLRQVHRFAACALGLALIGTAAPARADEIDCGGRRGIDLARCERHQKMAGQCEPLKGDAHFACDRDFLIANPLECKALDGNDAQRCTAEGAAIKACAHHPGRAFMRCVRDAVQASPMGTP